MMITATNKPQDTDMLAANTTNISRMPSAQKNKAAAKAASLQKIDETAQEFEAQFISQMLGSMNATVGEDNELGGGEAEQTYKSFLNNEYGKIIARAGGIGVTDQVKQEMLQMQEAASQ